MKASTFSSVADFVTWVSATTCRPLDLYFAASAGSLGTSALQCGHHTPQKTSSVALESPSAAFPWYHFATSIGAASLPTTLTSVAIRAAALPARVVAYLDCSSAMV